MQHLLTAAGWEFSRGDEKRWIPVEDRPAMAGWGFDSPGDPPWRSSMANIQSPAGLMRGDAGGTTCSLGPIVPTSHSTPQWPDGAAPARGPGGQGKYLGQTPSGAVGWPPLDGAGSVFGCDTGLVTCRTGSRPRRS
jgi:hypothetical protein